MCPQRERTHPQPNTNVVNELHHGDFLELAALAAGRTFDVIIADPPYNIGKDFGNNKGDMPLPDYLSWTDQWLSVCMERLSDTGVVYVYGFPEILAHVAVRYPLDRQKWLVWHYTNKTVPSSKFWQRSHESILCLWKSTRPNLNIDPIREEYTKHYKRVIGSPRKETSSRFNNNGKRSRPSVYNGHENGALPRDVLKVPALAGGAGRRERWFLCRDCGNRVYPPSHLRKHEQHNILKHPTQKPMKLTRRLLQSCIAGSDGSVLIPFAGSGSECVVAQSLGITFWASELNKEYVNFARQWLELIKDKHV